METPLAVLLLLFLSLQYVPQFDVSPLFIHDLSMLQNYNKHACTHATVTSAPSVTSLPKKPHVLLGDSNFSVVAMTTFCRYPSMTGLRSERVVRGSLRQTSGDPQVWKPGLQ